MDPALLTHRPFTTSQAADLGMTKRDLAALVLDGTLRRPVRGVYVDARASDSRELRIACIELIKPSHAVACSETASWLMGVDTFKPSERFLLVPSFLVPHAESRLRRPGVSCRQAIVPDDDIVLVGDVASTSPVRTASDLLRRLYRPYALAAGDGFLRAGLVTHHELMRFVSRLKGFPGIVQARSLVTQVDARAESPGESWQRLRITDAGFPPPDLQILVTDLEGNDRRIDMGYENVMIGSEFDGREFHTRAADVLHDSQRRDLLGRIGWRWVNATRERLFGPDTSFEQELGALLGISPRPRTWGGGNWPHPVTE
ncbi:type IV toxin-antitoxin system AbiEi family antitoxin domain-containing protein [Aeromicrobium sp. CTD01-1L150]|uniref:type IV toxin-antitoxin system AbiEi family antitoxin domain-containing protein n=1 Tax=Aeromicrobium sp. CTD01-1L150 TaxID=3341830 RepID=UPI0035C18CFC